MEAVREHVQSRIITRGELLARLQHRRPHNGEYREGYALVNVEPWQRFAQLHIPGSINIAYGNEDEFENLFAKDKEIIVYGASPVSGVATAVIAELHQRGFSNVIEFAGGLSDWRLAGGQVHQHHLDGDY